MCTTTPSPFFLILVSLVPILFMHIFVSTCVCVCVHVCVGVYMWKGCCMPVHVGWEQRLKFKYILSFVLFRQFLCIALNVLKLIL